MRYLYLSIILFVFSCRSVPQKTFIPVPKQGLVEYLKYKPGFKPMVSSHRGGGDIPGYPENCLESFAYLAGKIPNIIECDIEITKDSVLMMMHDNSLDRTTTGKGKIINQNWADMKDLNLKDNAGKLTSFKIPTLEQVLKWGKNKVIFTLDVKRNTPYEKVVAMVKQLQAENYCVIITYDVNQARKVYNLDPNLMISVTIRDLKEYERHHEAGIPDKNMVAFIGTREPNKEFNDFLHQKGIVTILGTLGNLDKMAGAKGDNLYKEFVNKGADILSTDRMIEAYKAIQ
ncbi:glycerophosphodiester phosphodiesterase family protein [Emticicia sp. 21SJ11W-3]|uniref:glycerophosphodiester phosphodiesterase family protein n=1 Tax=Emticicia sp. 21SJ11W-3 TaxID=2916755 RepID=UPI0020A022FE|nr:glycerophosphodiester phosphodiesterase family protein [Emticicia sp. 21SJ11W-3]UTA66156.1 glycerophosphodiester phosphodiesterase family protein [Emticicia sp. 21SJ11W-3]